MTAMVRFRAGGTAYAVPVDDVRQVRLPDGLAPLPSGRPGVAGLVRQDGAALPVLSTLGEDRGRLLVLEADGRPFGLLVESVSGVVGVEGRQLAPPPEGQSGPVVTGVADLGGELVLVVDATAIARATLGEPGEEAG